MLDSKEVLNLFTGNLSLRDPITIGSDELETPFDAEKERVALDLILSIIKEIPGAYLITSSSILIVVDMGLLFHANMIHKVLKLLG